MTSDRGDALVRLDGVAVVHGCVSILRDVALDVAAGAVVTVVGPNGAGKSTLLKVALGLVTPQSGSVWRRAGLRIGYVPQRLGVDPTMPLTAIRLLRLAVPRGTPPAVLTAALDRVGVADVAERQVSRLSGGELQRVMLARAMLRRPHLLVLDEPVAGVDIAGQGELYDQINRQRDETGCGVLMVSHDLHLVMAASDRVVCLNGHVCCAGHPEAVSRDPAYHALFGDLGPALAVYQHHHDHAHDAAGRAIPPPGAVAACRDCPHPPEIPPEVSHG